MAPDYEMQLRPIGVGNWKMTRNDHHSAFLLDIYNPDGELFTALIDCGSGTLKEMVHRDMDVMSLDAICITHFHLDHFGDLAAIASHRILEDRQGTHNRPLLICGPPGLSKRWQQLFQIYCGSSLLREPAAGLIGMYEHAINIDANDHVMFRTVPGRLDAYFSSFIVHHADEAMCLGYRFQCGNKSAVFTGDVRGPIENQLESFFDGTRNATVLVIEAGATKPSNAHLTVAEAVRHGRDCAQQTLINHVPPNHIEDAMRQINAMCGGVPGHTGKIRLAVEGETVVI